MASMNETPCITFHEKSSRDQLFENIKEAVERLAAQSHQIPKPKIQRVPFMLRDYKKFIKCYEPRALAIGPLHHGKPNCELAEKVKLTLAATFINESGHQAEDLYKMTEDNINILRDCYDEESTKPYDDEALAQLFFLDGCSTLQFIYSLMHAELAKFMIKGDLAGIAEQDLFLLENQLPYQVLKLLMSSSEKHEELKMAIEAFVHIHNMAAKKKKWYLHTHQLGDTAINMENMENTEEDPTHLLELLLTRMLGPKKFHARRRRVKDRPQSTRNIRELKAVGIHVRANSRDVSFTSLGFVGILRLPVPNFFNLIAYEMCPDFQNDFGVTAYIGFLDSLIDQANDVKQLRSAGVLYNLLGSDEEVAQLFNEVGTDLVLYNDTYRTVLAKLETHYKSKWKTWMGQFCQEHFSSPWTILAFIGVLAALGLTGIQTSFSLFLLHRSSLPISISRSFSFLNCNFEQR